MVYWFVATYVTITLLYIALHLADAFDQSDLQGGHSSKYRVWGQCRVQQYPSKLEQIESREKIVEDLLSVVQVSTHD